MQAKKEIVAGRLYMMSCYSAGFLPSQNKKQRAARKEMQTEYRKKMNKINRKYELMRLFAINFKSNRDLFIELSFAQEPTRQDEERALRRFHRRMTNYFRKCGREYRYILVRETHNRNCELVRVHYHLICTGTGKLMKDKIIEFWDSGSVDVRSLREIDNFEDTCKYLLKEEKPINERAYRCSRNLKRPEEPLRRKLPERECCIIPNGVERINHYSDDNDFGRYEIFIGKIVDEKAFNKYWELAKLDSRRHQADRNWRKYARENRRKTPVLCGGI